MLGEVFYWVFNMSIAATICMVPILLLRRIKKIPRRFLYNENPAIVAGFYIGYADEKKGTKKSEQNVLM